MTSNEMKPGAPEVRIPESCAHCGAPFAGGNRYVSRDGERAICDACFEKRRRLRKKRWESRKKLMRGILLALAVIAFLLVVYWMLAQPNLAPRLIPRSPE